MLPGANPYSDQIHKFIDTLFKDLEQLISQDPAKFVSDLSKIDQNLKAELQKVHAINL
jgi:hypothetical protein